MMPRVGKGYIEFGRFLGIIAFLIIERGRSVTGARRGRIAEMRVRFPSSPLHFCYFQGGVEFYGTV